MGAIHLAPNPREPGRAWGAAGMMMETSMFERWKGGAGNAPPSGPVPEIGNGTAQIRYVRETMLRKLVAAAAAHPDGAEAGGAALKRTTEVAFATENAAVRTPLSAERALVDGLLVKVVSDLAAAEVKLKGTPKYRLAARESHNRPGEDAAEAVPAWRW